MCPRRALGPNCNQPQQPSSIQHIHGTHHLPENTSFWLGRAPFCDSRVVAEGAGRALGEDDCLHEQRPDSFPAPVIQWHLLCSRNGLGEGLTQPTSKRGKLSVHVNLVFSPHFSRSRSPGADPQHCALDEGWDMGNTRGLGPILRKKRFYPSSNLLWLLFSVSLYTARYEGLDQAVQCDHYIQDRGMNVGCVLQNLSQAEYQDLNICVNGSAAAILLRPLYTTFRLHNLGNDSREATGDPCGHHTPQAHFLR